MTAQRSASAQQSTQRRVVVIGAGIVGVCCALWLRRSGHRVTLVDGNDPGTVTSCGNACSIATHACVAINHPDLLWRLPKLFFGMMFSQSGGPLSIDPLYAARHLPWFVNFLKHCRAREVEKTTAALAQMLAHAFAGLEPLLAMAECEHLLDDKGCLYAYKTERDFIADQKNLRTRREHGVDYTELDADEVRRLEPNLKIDFARGVLFGGSQRVVNPQTLVDSLFDCFRRHGGHWRKQHARAIRRGDALAVQLANGDSLVADKIVIAAGAFSTQIEGSGAQQLPLEAERGYHVQFNHRQELVKRPVHWVGSGFYATPTDHGLRFAGTVEMAGLSPKKNLKTLDYLTRMAKQMFDLDGEPEQTWLGYRPTLPDALPVIGASARCNDILLAFGHQHLGLTLAGITGKIIAQLIDGQPTAVDITPFDAARFAHS